MSILWARQEIVTDDNGDEFIVDDGFWWTRTGQIIRWSIFFGIFFLFIAYLVGGRWHAKRRLNKGLRPLAYHRWMLNRRERARYDPAYQNPSVFYNQYGAPGGQYGMHSMPPPMYDPNAPAPPTYQPPAGATKVDPSQWRSEPTRRPAESGEPSPEYEAPAGPPPVRSQNTGRSEASNNPYRL